MRDIHIPQDLWKQMMDEASNRMTKGRLAKPIVFALYTNEKEHYKVIDIKEIRTVRVSGNYPEDYSYTYPGIRDQGFYPKKGLGMWFSGTLVVGDGLDLDEGDKRWMKKDEMYFRIKVDIDLQRKKAHIVDFAEVSVSH